MLHGEGERRRGRRAVCPPGVPALAALSGCCCRCPWSGSVQGHAGCGPAVPTQAGQPQRCPSMNKAARPGCWVAPVGAWQSGPGPCAYVLLCFMLQEPKSAKELILCVPLL